MLKGVDEDLATFRECELRIVAIAYSTYAKIFRDKIERLLKELKFVLNFFSYWKEVQKYWAYLLPIFSQKDIALSMPDAHEDF